MNRIEQTFAVSAGLDSVRPGDRISVVPSMMLANDGSALKAIKEFQDLGFTRIIEPMKTFLGVNDKVAAASYSLSAPTSPLDVQAFCIEHGLQQFYDYAEETFYELMTEKINNGRDVLVVGSTSYTSKFGALGVVPLVLSPFNLARCWGEGKLEITVPDTIYIEISGQIQWTAAGEDVASYLLTYFGVDGLAGKAVIIGGTHIKRMSLEERMALSCTINEMGAMTGIIAPQGPTGQVERVIKIRVDEIKR